MCKHCDSDWEKPLFESNKEDGYVELEYIAKWVD